MRRRDKASNHVWLRRLPEEDTSVDNVPHGGPLAATATHIDVLTGECRLWLELERTGATYRLRCYPRRDGVDACEAPFAASYAGNHLTMLLARACEDYRYCAQDMNGVQLSSLEHVRWVV